MSNQLSKMRAAKGLALALVASFALACSGTDAPPPAGDGLQRRADARVDGASWREAGASDFERAAESLGQEGPLGDGRRPDFAVDLAPADLPARELPLADLGAGDQPARDLPAGDLVPVLCTPTAEQCDGLDNNCNGIADEGLTGCDSCAFDLHELPVVTHWSAASHGYLPMASDPIEPYLPYSGGAGYQAGSCYRYYRYGDYPDYGAYPGDRYSFEQIADGQARDVARAICRDTGVPLSFLRPDAFINRAAGLGRLRERPGRVQVIHSKEIAGSLFSIYLPANWSANVPAGTYPIVANGNYDINANVFREEGQPLARAIALSGASGRSGAIGLLWNGGGTGGRTMNRQAYDQFAAAIDWVAKNLGGDRYRILMWGVSRGGYTTVAMASNPYQHDYRVVFAAPGAMPALIGEHAELQSPTYPGVLGAVAWSTGLHDAWRHGWRYPACAGKAHLTGKSGPQAHCYLLTGTSDFRLADATRSPLAKLFIDGLKAAGTELYMEVTAHDNIVPYVHQLQYAKRLLAEGLPVEVDVLLRAGHVMRSEDGLVGHQSLRFNRLVSALHPMVEKGIPAYHVTPGMKFFRVDRQTQQFESFVPSGGFHPFTVELPYRAVRGEPMVMVFAGHPGTAYQLDILDSANAQTAHYEGTLDATMRAITWVDIGMDVPLGVYHYRLQIKKPGQLGFVEIAATNTPSGDLAVTHLEAAPPNADAAGVVSWAMGPTVNGFAATNWGLSEY